ncbi:MAG TPA: PQQ-binding-like beta-propeller repeat protein [Chloroflexota bacterium]|nr:PQQ-binding-like beta-propeller repeat protein [Chloroflexota bacterium]
MRPFLALLAVIIAIPSAIALAALSRPPAHPALQLHLLWERSVSPNADSNPAYIAHPRGHTAMIYVLAGNNGANCNPGNPVRRATLYAFDATTGRVVWHASTSGPSRCTTAGPTADPSGRFVYAVGLDGRLHRYNSASGRETKGHGWPVRITLMPDVEKVASTPAVAGGHIYVATSGFIGDQGHYEGHLVTVSLGDGTVHVFNSLCSNIPRLLGPSPGTGSYCSFVQSGLFGRGEAEVDPIDHSVYIVSGNGPWNGRTNWGDSVLKLSPDGSRLLDSYTPTDQQYLDDNDLDLGSTGPALLPAVTHGGHTWRLMVQGGKGPACSSCGPAVLRLLNRDNLSGHHALGTLGGDLDSIAAPGGCEVLTAPAVWKHEGQAWAIYANDCGLAAYRVAFSHGPRLQRLWSIGQGGTTPILAHGILYVAHSGALNAYAPATGKLLGSAPIGPVHWEYPAVTGNRVYITDQSGKVRAFRMSR